MRHWIIVGAALALAPLPLAAQRTERVTLEGSRVAIYNLVGTIRATRGAGASVTVTVTPQGRDAGQLSLRQGSVDGHEALRVIYPAQRITFDELGRESRTTVPVRADGTFGGDGGHGGGTRIEISGRSGGLDARADLDVEIPAGHSVDINLVAGKVSVTNVEGDVYVDVHAADVTTAGTKGILSLDTGSGTVEVSDAEGPLSLDSGSGAVTLTRLRGSRLVVDAGSGRIRGDDLRFEEVNLDVGSGGVTLRGVDARELRLDAGSGGTEIELVSLARRVKVDSGSGNLTLWVPANFGARLDVETGSGGIDVELPVKVTRWESDHLVGTIGDGSGSVEIDAGSGSVRIRKRP